MTILLSTQGEGLERLNFSLGQDVTLCKSVPEVDNYLEQNPSEVVVLVGPDVDMEVATEISERYRSTRPTVGVIVIRRRIDMPVLVSALRAGVREVVMADDTLAIVNACSNSAKLSQKISGPNFDSNNLGNGKVILVFSAKGGCGKTTLSTNLAVALSSDPEVRVCLVDFDLQFGDVGVSLRLDPQRSISDAVDMKDHLDKQGIASLVTKYSPNLDVLLAPANPVDAEYISGDLGRSILENLKKMYDFVVIDSSPAFTDVILESFEIADKHILMTTLDIPTLKNLRVSISTLDELGIDKSKRIFVVNHSTMKTGISIQDAERAIGAPVDFQIPSSVDVPISTNRGQILVASSPKHEVSRAVRQIANSLKDEGSDSSARRRRGRKSKVRK